MKSRQQKDSEKPWRKKVSNWNSRIKKRGSDTRVDLIWCLSYKKCCYCNIELTVKNASLDHKQPLSQGGRDEIINYHLVCKRDNRAKGSLNHIQYTTLLEILSKPPFGEREKKMIIAKMMLGFMADRG